MQFRSALNAEQGFQEQQEERQHKCAHNPEVHADHQDLTVECCAASAQEER